MKIFLFLLLILSGTAQAQNKLTDSLALELSKAKTDSDRVELYCQLSKQYYLSDTKKAVQHAQLAEKLATKAGYLRGKAKALNLIGYSYLVLGQFDKGLVVYLQSLGIYEQVHDTLGIVASYNSLATMYHKIEDQDKALEYYQTASEYAQKINDKLGLSKVYNNIGNVYEVKGEYKKALAYFVKAAKLQEALGDKRSLAISLLNIGNVHLYFDHPEAGLPYLFRSLRLDEQIHNQLNPVSTLKSISKIYQAMGNNEEALKYAKQSYEQAIETKSGKKIAAAAELMQRIYAGMKDYEQAYKYQSAFIAQEAILDKESQKKAAAEITAKYETDKKEIENSKLKAEKEKQNLEIKHQNMVLAVAGAIMLLLMLLTGLLYRSQLRLKISNLRLQKANNYMEAQHIEINKQRDELRAQAVLLKDQNEQLEKNHKFKNKVFSIISHDLRAPFSSIKGILNLSQSDILSAAEVQNIFSILSKDVDTSMNMLHNLLVWSKAQLTESKINLQPVNINLLVEENIHLAASLTEQKNITVINAIPENTIAFTDKERLNFVVRNLFMNAIKFTYEGGNITLQAAEQKEIFTLRITDNGRGISARNMARLFTEERFTTVGTLKERGTGLGLMLCKELAESLHGNITVASEEGKGSTFSIILPNAAMPVVQNKAVAAVS